MTLNGIDISGWQPNIDLSKVPADFVIIKATGGTGFVSTACDSQYQQAKRLGKLKGIYHFAREAGYRGTAAQEAAHFLNTTRGYQDGKTLLVLDWEGDNTTDVGWALDWLNRVYKATGVRPIIYMSSAVANATNWSPVANAGYGIWIAAYVLGYQRISGYSVPSGLAPVPYWGTLAMWQYTSAGRITGWGADLDLNIFYGDAKAWLRYCAPTLGAQSTTVTPIKEDTLSAAEVNQIKTYIDKAVEKVNNYTGALLVSGWSNATGQHPGVALVVEQNQREVRALAKTPASAPVTLTDEQIQQIIAAIPPATLAALATQLNK